MKSTLSSVYDRANPSLAKIISRCCSTTTTQRFATDSFLAPNGGNVTPMAAKLPRFLEGFLVPSDGNIDHSEH